VVPERGQPRDARSRLLAAGVDVVLERLAAGDGVLQGLSITEVADRAGLARSALYRYWPLGNDGPTPPSSGFSAYLRELAGELAARRVDAGALALGTLAASDELDEVLGALAGPPLGAGSTRWWASVVAIPNGTGDWRPARDELAPVLELVLQRAGYQLAPGRAWKDLATAWLIVCDGAALAEGAAVHTEDVKVQLLESLVHTWCTPHPSSPQAP
jgi:AcrR family transcriptional regulator